MVRLIYATNPNHEFLPNLYRVGPNGLSYSINSEGICVFSNCGGSAVSVASKARLAGDCRTPYSGQFTIDQSTL